MQRTNPGTLNQKSAADHRAWLAFANHPQAENFRSRFSSNQQLVPELNSYAWCRPFASAGGEGNKMHTAMPRSPQGPVQLRTAAQAICRQSADTATLVLAARRRSCSEPIPVTQESNQQQGMKQGWPSPTTQRRSPEADPLQISWRGD